MSALTLARSLPPFAERWLALVERAVTGASAWDRSECHPEADDRHRTTPPMPHTCATLHTAPYSATRRTIGRDWPTHGFTMVGHVRLRNIREQLERVCAQGVPGSFAELGVWRGGASLYARAVLEALGERATGRRVHLFDAFGALRGYGLARNYLSVPLREVELAFEKFDLMSDAVRFHPGLFNESLPRFGRQVLPPPIAVLRIDGNFYESYTTALYHLWDSVPLGGAIIFDDFAATAAVPASTTGPRAAWEDFKREHALREQLRPVDWTSSYVIKETGTRVAWGRYDAARRRKRGKDLFGRA